MLNLIDKVWLAPVYIWTRAHSHALHIKMCNRFLRWVCALSNRPTEIPEYILAIMLSRKLDKWWDN